MSLLRLSVALALTLCACSPFKKTPAGFMELGRTRFDYQALSSDSVSLVGRHVEPDKPASLGYWTETIRNELTGTRGYKILAEEKIKTTDTEGVRFVCSAMREGTEFLYLLSLFYVPDWIGSDDVYVVESGGKRPAVERHRAALDAFVAGLSLR
jgi:hypothetical protein